MSTFQPGDRVRCVKADVSKDGRHIVPGVSVIVERCGPYLFHDIWQNSWWIDRFTRIGNPTIPEDVLLARLKGQTPTRARNPACGLGFGDEPPRLDPMQNDQAREMVGTIRALTRTATEMGLAAGLSRVPQGCNPFNDRFPDQRFAEAWASGWRVGSDGESA